MANKSVDEGTLHHVWGVGEARLSGQYGQGWGAWWGKEPVLTLDPDKAIEEVEAATSVGSGPPVCTTDLVGLLCEAGVLPDLVHDVRGQ